MDLRYDAEPMRRAQQAAPDERVLWAGRPGRRWLPGFMALKPTMLLVTVIGMLAWMMRDEPERLTRNWENFTAALLVLATPAVVGLALGAWGLRRRNREVYAVTERRVLILRSDGTTREAVGLERAGEFRLVGRTLRLGGEDEAFRLGKGDLDGGLQRFERLPRLERLAEPARVMAIIKGAAPKA